MVGRFDPETGPVDVDLSESAEAGHISQNLILAATALGLNARPFGGVFDDLLNEDLGLDTADEQFLLAVLVGHTPAR